MFNADYQHKLVSLITESLDEVAPALCKKSGWADIIGAAIEHRMKESYPEIECGYGTRGLRKRPEECEWLFDFVAGLWEPNDLNRERYLMQAVVVGEIECHHDLEKDFDKLLVADSLVYFFVFPDSIREHEDKDELAFFHDVAEKRCRFTAQRGLIPPPVFIIARRCSKKRTFSYRFAGDQSP